MWRTLERADVVVMVLDSRIPLFHLSDAILHYIRQDLHKPVVLCINKCDMIPPPVADLWVTFLTARHPDIPVVAFYVPKSTSGVVGQPSVDALMAAIRSRTLLRDGVSLTVGQIVDAAVKGTAQGSGGGGGGGGGAAGGR